MDGSSNPATSQSVDEARFRASLETLTKSRLDPGVGLFGPDSMYWEVNRHAVVYFVGALQSVQMQLCHPWVAVAVHAHSKILSDPTTRARLTYTFLWSLIYGDLDMATKKATGLYKVHGRVNGRLAEDVGAFAAGSVYEANEANALLWVHVTAFACRVKLYDRLVRPLSVAEKDRFVHEAKRYALCFGIPESMHPSTWAEVEAYLDAVLSSPTLGRTDAGMTIRRFLEDSLPQPARAALWRLVCVPLPVRIQELLDLPRATPANVARVARFERVLRFAMRVLPTKITSVPAWHEARARLAGRDGPDLVTRLLNRVFLGRPRLVS